MIDEDKILAYTNKHYPVESDLIGRSLINYYSLRMKEDKLDHEVFYQDQIFAGVLDLFEILSDQLSKEMDIDRDTIYKHLVHIHIKT